MEEVKKLYPYLIRNDGETGLPDDFPFTTISSYGEFIPLQIVDCNGGYPMPFSEAQVFVKAFPDRIRDAYELAIVDTQLYLGFIYEFYFRNDDQTKEKRRKALHSLVDFYANKQHRSCLKALNDLPKEDRPCEKTVQEVLALHLFQPLAMKPIDLKVNKSCVESATKERNHAKDCKGRSECFFCKTQIKTGNTSFGNLNVWHGKADVILDHMVIMVQPEQDEDTDNTIDDTETFELDTEASESYSLLEPFQGRKVKKMKKETADLAGGDAGGSVETTGITSTIIEMKPAKDSYMPYKTSRIPVQVNEVKAVIDKTLSQVLAQTIVNAYLQIKKEPSLKDHFIPTFLASDKHVTIHMYKPSSDTLVTQALAMPIFFSGKVSSDTVFSIWLAMNMLNFTSRFPGEKDPSSFYLKSNFQNLVGREKLEVYQEGLEMPITNSTPVSFNENQYRQCDLSRQFIFKQLQKMKVLANSS